MNAHPGSSPDLTRLLDESRWLSGLARRLVADPGVADDLVQDTLISALQAENRPGPDETRGWLATILRRKAISHHRSTKRRDHRERETARGEALPGPDKLSELLESEGLLRDALAELEEPYRRTVLLRYREGLSAAEIARRDGEPAGTVRWRLKSGLDQLRVELEKRDSNWAAALVPLTRLPAATALAAGGAAKFGSSPMLLGAAAAGVLALAGAAWWWVQGTEPASAASEIPAVARAVRPDASPSPSAVGSGPRTERAPVEAVVPGESAPKDERPSELGPAVVELRVRTAEGLDLAGAEVRDLMAETPDPASARSGSDGVLLAEFDLAGAREERLLLQVWAPGYASRMLDAELLSGVTVDLGTLVLEPAAAIYGQLLGAADSSRDSSEPDHLMFVGSLDESEVAKIRSGVGAGGVGDLFESLEVFGMATADPASGRFELNNLVAGVEGRVFAVEESAAGRIALSEPLVLEPGQVLDLGGLEWIEPLAVGPGLELIVRCEDEAALERSSITVWRAYADSGSLDPLEVQVEGPGRYRVAVEVGALIDVRIADPEGHFAPLNSGRVAVGTAPVELVFERLEPIELTVLTADGVPADDFELRVFEASKPGVGQAPEGLERLGNGRVAFLPPPFRWRAEAVAGDTIARSELSYPYTYSGIPELRLAPMQAVAGRVVRDGQPVQGLLVEARKCLAANSGSGWRGSELFSWVSPEPALARAVTDGSGEFRLDGLVRSEVAIGVTDEAGVLIVVRPAGAGPLELDLSKTGALDGVVGAEGGGSVGGVVTVWNASGIRRSAAFGKDGKVSFEALQPGRWYIAETENHFGSGWMAPSEGAMGLFESRFVTRLSFSDVPSVEVRVGETAAFTLYGDVELPIRGHITFDGERERGFNAVLYHSPEGSLRPVHQIVGIRGGGAFRANVKAGGESMLFLRGELEGQDQFIIVPIDAERAGSGEPFDVDVRRGLLRLTLEGDEEVLQIFSETTTSNGIEAAGTVTLEGLERGVHEIHVAVSGSLKLVRTVPGAASDDAEELFSGVLEPGGELEVRVP